MKEITKYDYYQIHNHLGQSFMANDYMDIEPNLVNTTIYVGGEVRSVKKRLCTSYNATYISTREREVVIIKKMVMVQKMEVVYYGGFIMIGDKTFNGFTKELVEEILGL